LAEVHHAAPTNLPLLAETDTDGVGFYTATGFTVTPLGEIPCRTAVSDPP